MIQEAELGRDAPKQGDIAFLDLPRAELLDQGPGGTWVQAEHQNAAGGPIEAMGWVHPTPQGVPYPLEHGPDRIAEALVGEDPRGLRDGHEVRVQSQELNGAVLGQAPMLGR